MTDIVKDKNSTITLNELRASVDETSLGGKPLNGIRHIDLVDGLLALSDKHGLKPELGPVTIQNGGPSKLPGISLIPYFEDKYGKNDTRSMILRRLFTSIMLKDEDGVQQMGLAFTYTQDGIAVAIGPRVSVCQNWCIYGADQMATTYMSNLKVPAEKLLDVVGGWMERYDNIRDNTFRMTERMKEISVLQENAEQFFGRLQLMRVAYDKSIERNGIYAMNQGQINTFAEDYLQWTVDHVETPTVWDFYNVGTNLLKPTEMEIGNLLPQSLRLGSAITDFFSLN